MNKLWQLIYSISNEDAVSENTHTLPKEGTGISWGWGVLLDQKFKEMYEA